MFLLNFEQGANRLGNNGSYRQQRKRNKEKTDTFFHNKAVQPGITKIHPFPGCASWLAAAIH